MTVLLNIATVPQDFAAGTYSTAATAINGGKWRVTITPTAASSTYTGGNFHAILGQFDGGLWFNDKSLELYTAPADSLACSIPLTWSAGQPITLSFDTRAGHLTVTITGATTGNSTVSLAFPGPYLDPTLLLEIGRQGGGANFAFVGGVSSIDDGVSSDAITPATITVSSNTINGRRGFKDASTQASVAITGGTIGEGHGGTSDNVTPAAITLTGQSVSVKRTNAAFVSSAHVDIAGGNVFEGQGGRISLGPTSMDFQRFGFANRASNITLNTPASGAVVLLCAGGKSSDVSTTWTDNKNAVKPVTIGALVGYSDFAGYGTIVAVTPAPMAGGAGHTFTQPVTTNDEDTVFGLVAVVAGGHPRVTEVHNEVANASGGTTQTSPSIATDDEALLVAYWWGASPVIPPFSTPSPGVGTPYTAVPNNGYTVAQSYLVNNEFGEVQAAMAYLYVPAGSGPSSRNVTWTHSPAQGAQLRLVAIQPARADGVTSGSIGVVGQLIGERVTYRVALVAASISITGGVITEGVIRMDSVTPATLAAVGGAVQDRRTIVVSTVPAALALSGGTVQDQVAHNQKDSVTAATMTLVGGAVGDQTTVIDTVVAATAAVTGVILLERRTTAASVTAAAVTVTGNDVPDRRVTVAAIAPAAIVAASASVSDRRAVIDNTTSAALTVVGATVLERKTTAASVTQAAVTITGLDVHEAVSNDPLDTVLPANVVLSGGIIGTRVKTVVSVESAALPITSGILLAAVARKAAVLPASLAIASSAIADKIARKGTVVAAAVAATGGTVQDAISSGAQDLVLPASLAVVGASLAVRVARIILMSPGACALRGGDVQSRVSTLAPEVVPPISPGRAETQLVGHVVVPSIESRESQLSHLYGVIRSKGV